MATASLPSPRRLLALVDYRSGLTEVLRSLSGLYPTRSTGSRRR